MNRSETIREAIAIFRDEGLFRQKLAELVRFPTVNTGPESHSTLIGYLSDGIGPLLRDCGFTCSIFENPLEGGGPFLVAELHENDRYPTILTYGHADVVDGMAGRWSDGREPFCLQEHSGNLYGRGTADNKGQHLLNLMALKAVKDARGGRLGFNCKVLIETSEEIGSVGLDQFVSDNTERLAADVLIASDGPRVAPSDPTLVLGLRGVMTFRLSVDLRSEAHHSGNWGGIIADPSIVLANALSAICSAKGIIKVPGWRPSKLEAVDRDALAFCPFDPGNTADQPDEDWGETGLSLWEKLALWPSFSIMGLAHGNQSHPENAIQPSSTAHCSLRFPESLNPARLIDDLRDHLETQGFPEVQVIRDPEDPFMAATKGDVRGPWASNVAASIEQTLSRPPCVLPSNGGSLPNQIFADTLGLETIWIPHSYNACQQHAPDEHVRLNIFEEAMRAMAGLWWDIGILSENME